MSQLDTRCPCPASPRASMDLSTNAPVSPRFIVVQGDDRDVKKGDTAPRITPKDVKLSSIPASIFNFFNGTVGSTTLGMAIAFQYMGWAVGVNLLFVIICFNVITCCMIVSVGIAEGVHTYDATIRTVLPPLFFRVYQGLLIFSTLGSLSSAMILMGDFVGAICALTGIPAFNRQLSIAVLACGIVLPLSLMRRVSSLAFSSTLSSAFVGLLVVALVYRLADRSGPVISPTVDPLPVSFQQVFIGISIMVQGLSSQTVAFPVYSELQHNVRNLRSFKSVTAWAFTFTFIAYGTVGLVGYFMFGSAIKGNVLKHFTAKGDILMTVVIACYLLKTIFAYPLNNFPLRVTLHYGLYKDAPATTTQHLLETIGPFTIALTFALVVQDVSILFSFVGAVARTSIAFTYPGALFLACKSLQPLSKWQRAGCWSLILLGVVTTVCGITATVYKVVP